MLKISLDALQVIDAIDRRGSFAAAGKELHKVPSTISYSVAELERGLGVQLFERVGARALLTDAGRALLQEGRHLLRAARDLELRVQRVASGWEAELSLAVDALFTPSLLSPLVGEFCGVSDQTRLRLSQEALSGTWEALLDRRADLLVAAAGEGPAGGGYVAEPLGTLGFVFVVAPAHPLARVKGVVRREHLAEHRAVAIADSARRLLPRTVGLLAGQATLTMPDMLGKYRLQCAGLGFGFLPEMFVAPALHSGRLVQVEVEEGKPEETFWLAWRSGEQGQALAWWQQRLRQPGVLDYWAVQMGQWLHAMA